jgi:hypothetical protein
MPLHCFWVFEFKLLFEFIWFECFLKNGKPFLSYPYSFSFWPISSRSPASFSWRVHSPARPSLRPSRNRSPPLLSGPASPQGEERPGALRSCSRAPFHAARAHRRPPPVVVRPAVRLAATDACVFALVPRIDPLRRQLCSGANSVANRAS